jgi:hypothetical protein
MKRYVILLLMCLLPLQVFAGALAYAEERLEPLAEQSEVIDLLAMLIDQVDDVALSDEDEAASQHDETLMTFSVGDEPIQVNFDFCPPDFARFTLAHASDTASPPPYLPPAGRPPRV